MYDVWFNVNVSISLVAGQTKWIFERCGCVWVWMSVSVSVCVSVSVSVRLWWLGYDSLLSNHRYEIFLYCIQNTSITHFIGGLAMITQFQYSYWILHASSSILYEAVCPNSTHREYIFRSINRSTRPNSLGRQAKYCTWIWLMANICIRQNCPRLRPVRIIINSFGLSQATLVMFNVGFWTGFILHTPIKWQGDSIYSYQFHLLRRA